MASSARAVRLFRNRPGTLAMAIALGLAATIVTFLAACGGSPPPPTEPTPRPPATAPVAARHQLAARAAAAKDRHYTAQYRVSGGGQPDRTVTVTIATDGTWRVDIPGGALGGTKTVAIVAIRTGMYQCLLDATGGCVKVAPPTGTVPAESDPRIQHLFTRWLDVFVDRDAALSVAAVTTPTGMTGACYSVEPTAVSLAPPVDPGTYCFGPDGEVTGARFGGVTVVPVGAPGSPPQTVTLPAPVVPSAAVPTAGPVLTTSSPSGKSPPNG